MAEQNYGGPAETDVTRRSDALLAALDALRPASSDPYYYPGGGLWTRNLGPPLQSFQITPTVLNADAYDSGDVLFDRTLISAQCFRVAGGNQWLHSVFIVDKDDQTAASWDLIFLNADVTYGTMDSAPSISDANATSIVARVPISTADWLDVGGAKIADVFNLNRLVWAAPGSQGLWVAASVTGTPTQTIGGIVMTLGFITP